VEIFNSGSDAEYEKVAMDDDPLENSLRGRNGFNLVKAHDMKNEVNQFAIFFAEKCSHVTLRWVQLSRVFIDVIHKTQFIRNDANIS